MDFQVGDQVKVMKIPSDLDDRAEIGTPRVFKRALGKTFLIRGFDRYGHVELEVTKRDTIWIEPAFLSLTRSNRARKMNHRSG